MNHTNKAAADTRPQKGMNNTCGSVFVSVFVSIFVSIFVSVFVSIFVSVFLSARIQYIYTNTIR